MKELLENFIEACQVCEFKTQKNKSKVKKNPYVVLYEENPLDRLQCDLITISDAIKEDHSKYNYILTVIDHHSKKTWAKLLKNKKAETVAQIMDKLFSKMFATLNSYPLLLHCDNGGEFRNEHL